MNRIYYKLNQYNKISCYSLIMDDEAIEADITDEQLDFINKNLGNCAVRETDNGIEFYYAELSEEEQAELTALRNSTLPFEIRERRKSECFPYINRGELWHKNLTEEQKTELETWYNAWLNAPATLIIPDKPEWLK